jgi:hypothetical protein
VAREMKMWQERRLCGKRGKRDKTVAREMKMWQERCQRGNSTLSGNMEKKIKFPLFSIVWQILSITSQIECQNFYNMY